MNRLGVGLIGTGKHGSRYARHICADRKNHLCTWRNEAVAAARKPVLFEKPAAVSVAAARAMLAHIRDGGIQAMVAQTLRYNSVVRAVCASLASIGAVHAVRLSQRFEPSPLGWIDDPEVSGGGMILHLACTA
jgi:predicted dehydrogenase